MGGQRTADQVQIGGVGQKQGGSLVITGLEVLRARFDGGHFGVSARSGRLGFDHAHVVKVPRYRA